MSSPTPDQDQVFLELVARFITLANELNASHHRSRISAALLSAAARYNAFTWMHREIDPGQAPEAAAEFFATHYKAMFRENLRYLESLAAKK